MDTLAAYLSDDGDIQLIDPRESLLRRKESEQIYLLTDGHWNEFGAHTGYLEIMYEVSKLYPQVEPLSRQDFKESIHIVKDGIQARRSGISELFNEEEVLLEPNTKLISPDNFDFPLIRESEFTNLRSRDWTATNNPHSDGPVVLLLNDSFGEHWRKWLPYSFSKFVSVRSDDLISDKQLRALLENLQPDLVIEQFTSRKIIPMPGVVNSLTKK